jgi:DNA (cytosine-5)-methyltransferase 1
VVVGGPPCQGFSNANRQKNHIVSQNNSLVKKYVEVIENLKPLAFVMENVQMLRSETHRFYLSSSDQNEIKRLGINVRKETLCLFTGICPVDDIEEYLLDSQIIGKLILPEKAFHVLRVFLKRSYKEENVRRC